MWDDYLASTLQWTTLLIAMSITSDCLSDKP
jgi:hypothetical protein